MSGLPRVNLLPPEIAEQARFRKVQAGLAATVVVAAAVVGMMYVGATGQVTEANDRIATLASEQTRLQAESAKFADVTATYDKAAAAQKLLVSAMGTEVRYSTLLNDLGQSIPDNVWLESATYTQTPGTTPVGSQVPSLGTVTFAGVAFAHNDVATWLEALAKQKGFADPQLQSSTEALLGTRTVVNWTVTVNITDAALSGRFTTPVGG